MNVSANNFKKQLQADHSQVGLWLSLCSSVSAEITRHCGYDWVLIDMEHSPNSLQSVTSQMQVFEASSSNVLVRPYWNDTVLVKRLLDAGATTLLFPMIQSAEEARQAVAATRYPPKGIRGVSGSTRANAYGRVSDYFTAAENELCVLVQIETAAAIEKAIEIGSVEGVDGVFFGPADIAADIGHLGKPLCDEVWDLVMPAAKALMAKDIAVGTLVQDVGMAVKLFKEGFNFIACGADAGLLAKSTDQLLHDVKAGL